MRLPVEFPLVLHEHADPKAVCRVYTKTIPRNLGNIPGQGSTSETNEAACRDRCYGVDKCVYWTYWDTHGCDLSLGGGPLVAVDEAVTTGKNPKLCGGK